MKVGNSFVEKLIKEKSFAMMSDASIISITDEKGIILFANENFARISGYSVDELIGQDHNLVNSQYHPKSFWAAMWKTVKTGKIWRAEVKNKTKTGTFYWVDSQVMAIKDDKGKHVAYLSVRNDITHEKEQELELLQSKTELQASELHYRHLHDNTPIMYFVLERSGLIKSVNKFGADQLGYKPKELIGHSVFNIFPSLQQQEAANHVARCLKKPGKVLEWEIQKVRKDGAIIWVKEVAWAEPDPSGELVVTVACEDITAVKRAAEALMTENKLLVNGPTVAFKWKAAEGWPVEFVSSNVLAVFGYNAIDFTSGRIIFGNVIHPEDVDRVATEVGKYSDMGRDIFDQEYRIIRADGEVRWIRDHTIIIRNEHGVPTHYQGHIYDYTERKLAKQETELLNSRLTALIESIPDAIFFKDGESRWLITNETAKKLFKLQGLDWYNKTEMELADLHPDFRPAHEKCLVDDELAWREGKLTLFSEFITDENNVQHEYEVRKMPIFNDDGSRKALVIIGTDVTERKQGEADLLQTKKMLEQTMRLAKIGGFEVDFTTSVISWSGLTREFVEVPEEYVPELETLFNFYKEGESRDKMKALVERAINEGIGFETEVQLTSCKGKEYWLRTIHEPKMVNGKCVKLFGYFQDITEKVEMNKKNQQIERKFSHLIEKSTDGIILQNIEGVILYASRSIKNILGFDPEEMIGHDPIEYFHPEDRNSVIERRIQLISMAANWTSLPFVAERLRRKDGQYIYVEGTITNLLNDEAVNAVVSNFRDVTQKKTTEENLRSKNERLEQIAWLFSHKVRGPVATILGLARLFNHIKLDDPINEEVIAKMLIPVSKLDEITSQIVQETNEIGIISSAKEPTENQS